MEEVLGLKPCQTGSEDYCDASLKGCFLHGARNVLVGEPLDRTFSERVYVITVNVNAKSEPTVFINNTQLKLVTCHPIRIGYDI